jgi:hypothetical protein
MKITRLLAASAGVGALLLAGVLVHGRPASAKAPSVLRAQGLELVDGRGRVRAQINVYPSGEVVLRMRDQAGTVRVKLGADSKGSGLLLLDEATEPGVHVLAGSKGTSLTLQRAGKRNVLMP